MDHFILTLLLLVFFTSLASSQQYSPNLALDCNTNEDTAFLYTCNAHRTTCEAFLIFKSQPSYGTVHTIARINQVKPESEFPQNKEVIVPVNCSCLGQYYQANSTVSCE
ncbi:protein kinase family protein / peptidoglycan-binding LysM domain-containing protein [Euphorbia peplus]|nr:protein kinase family protein / peptidoglycan-binding LysM domain-containing protein [Euphorbia peplus]